LRWRLEEKSLETSGFSQQETSVVGKIANNNNSVGGAILHLPEAEVGAVLHHPASHAEPRVASESDFSSGSPLQESNEFHYNIDKYNNEDILCLCITFDARFTCEKNV
jgi:hypothetical protein